MTGIRRIEILVRGRVQGVFYRDSTRRKAKDLGLVGAVRNLPDGSVRIVAEGPDAALEALLQWCKVGPPAAEVKNASAVYSTPTGEFGNFIITY